MAQRWNEWERKHPAADAPPVTDEHVLAGWHQGLATLATFHGDSVQAAMLVGCVHRLDRYALARLATAALATDGVEQDLGLVTAFVGKFWRGWNERLQNGLLVSRPKPPPPGVPGSRAPGVVLQGWTHALTTLACYRGDPVQSALLVAGQRHLPPMSLARLATSLLAAEGREHDIQAINALVQQFNNEDL